jgi:hypothetical protein
MAETLAEKLERRRKLDVAIARAFLADAHDEYSIQTDWARRVLEAEQKMAGKELRKCAE